MKRTALFPGTFDPMTNGHFDLIVRAARLFDHLLIGVAQHATGKQPFFSFDKRLTMVQAAVQSLEGVTVKGFSGFLVDFFDAEAVSVIIRGVRCEKDFEYEFQMAQVNRTLNHRVETLFMPPSADHLFMCASMVREILHLGGPINAFVPKAVEKALAHV